MGENFIDVRDSQVLFSTLSLVVFFTEQLNTLYAKHIRQHERVDLASLIKTVPESLEKLSADSGETSEVLSWLLRYTINRELTTEVQSRVIQALVNRMLVARGLMIKASSAGTRASELNLLHTLSRPADQLWLYQHGRSITWANTELPWRTAAASIELQKSLYISERVNAVETAHDFLIHVVRVRPNSANHYIQQWLKKTFDLSYTTSFKYRLATIVWKFNELFYGVATPSRQEGSQRSTTVSVGLLLDEIATILSHAQPGEPTRGQREESKSEDVEKVALGIYFFLRVCNVLSCRFHWPDERSTPEEVVPGQRTLSSKPGKIIRGEDQAWTTFWESPYVRQCVDALYPLEYSYFQTRIFGALSGIPGLNNVFRGGLLPHVEDGRTFVVQGPPGSGKTAFALHMMADMAYRGRIAFYFSLEESYDTIRDRLVTFNLLDDDKFEVWQGGEDTLDTLKDRLNTSDNNKDFLGKGLLFLYGHHGSFDLLETIAKIADVLDGTTNRRGLWRALTIDGVSALTFHTGAEPEPEPDAKIARQIDALIALMQGAVVGEDPGAEIYRQIYALREMYALRALTQSASPEEEIASSQPRRALMSLIECIEDHKFWGLLLSEDDPKNNSIFGAMLPSVADTVVRLGLTENKQGRWLQIEKSRTQNYHPGRHVLHLSDGKGISISASLEALRTKLRRRGITTLSTDRVIPLSPKLLGQVRGREIAERSSTLFWGESGLKKSFLLLHIATESSQISNDKTNASSRLRKRTVPVKNILVVTFRTSEFRFLQTVRTQDTLSKKWDMIPVKNIWYYSPGESLSCERILSEIEQYIYRNKLAGIPIERMLFTEVASADHVLPALHREPLFWPTLLQLLSTEGITSFFAVTGDEANLHFIQLFRNWVDYSFCVTAPQQAKGPLWNLKIEKQPFLLPIEQGITTEHSETKATQ
jgi:KaiC/GvpD/RAD55 family RecA-like ATPase